MLEDALEEQRRLVALLDGLQALARGEATSHEHEDVDLADVVTRAVADTRARYPATTFALDLPDAPVVLRGWEPGLRLLVANLVDQRRPPRPRGGNVRVTLTAGPAPVLTVDDDGDGIPEARSRPHLRAVPAARGRRGPAGHRARARARRAAGARTRGDACAWTPRPPAAPAWSSAFA